MDRDNSLDTDSYMEFIVDNVDESNLEKQKTRRYKKDTILRKSLAVWVKWTVSLWLLGVFVIILVNSFRKLNLSDGVLIALLTTTTINILGLAAIVLRGLFRD